MFVMKTKKTLLTTVTLSVVTLILVAAAAADEIIINRPASADIPAAATVITAPPAASEEPQNAPPAAESTDSQSIGAVSRETTPTVIQASHSAPPPTETEAEQESMQPVQDMAPCGNLILRAGQTIAEYAKQYDGVRYVYGAESPKHGFDCSGLVYHVYTHFGFALPRRASVQYKNGVSVGQPDLQPGDLVFFDTNGGSRSISHVGIYIGDGQFIHASTSRGVMISRLDDNYWSKAYYGAKRIITPKSVLRLFSTPASAMLV